jgi:inner membrane protein
MAGSGTCFIKVAAVVQFDVNGKIQLFLWNRQMPTPVAHTLCGYVCYEISSHPETRRRFAWMAGMIAAANLADMDYLPGVVINQPNSFHHGMSHSLLFAVLFGILAGAVTFAYKRQFWNVFLWMTLAYTSHILLDFFTMDTSAPFGEQLLWPFSSEYYLSPVSIFRDVSKGSTNATFFSTALGSYNLKTLALECGIFIPLVFFIRYMKTGKHEY